MEYVRVPRLLLDLGMSPRRRPKEDEWIARSGIKLTGDGRYGAPFGRTRVILLYLAAKAAEIGAVIDGHIDEITDMFQLGWKYNTLQEHFIRLIRCAFSRIGGMDTARSCCERHVPGMERIALIETAHYCKHTRRFRIVCSQWFVEQAREAILCQLDTVRTIISAERFAVLDLYVWYQWRLARKEYSTVDAFGPDGPYHLLSIPGPTGKSHQSLVQWHQGVLQYWPDCPFRVVGNGTSIVCDVRGQKTGSIHRRDQPGDVTSARPAINSVQVPGTKAPLKSPTQHDSAPPGLQATKPTTPVSKGSKLSSPQRQTPKQRSRSNQGERRPARDARGASRTVLRRSSRRVRAASTQTAKKAARVQFPPPVPKTPQLRTPQDVRRAAEVLRESVRSISRALRELGVKDSSRGPPDSMGT